MPTCIKRYFAVYGKVPNKSVATHVGYFNDSHVGMHFIIPKVFDTLAIDDQFWSDCAQQGLEVALLGQVSEKKLLKNFFSKFTLIFFLSLKKFHDTSENTTILSEENVFRLDSNLRPNEVSELEIVLSLIEFSKKNKNFLAFKRKSHEDSSAKHVDWNKTIKKSLPLISEGGIIYNVFLNKDTERDNFEILLTIYFSLLKYLNITFGFKAQVDEVYATVSFKNVDRFEEGCSRNLKKMKGKYFDDRLKKLYSLLVAYFDIKAGAKSRKNSSEYVFASNYNIIFESMIDHLLSDNSPCCDLKYQEDGKIIDHLFEYDSFFNEDPIYYIGDSKYYKKTTSLSRYSTYKQFTYAKNIIQYNVDLFNRGDTSHIKYRDDLTEGYNVTPNFFIQATVNDFNIEQPGHRFLLDEDVPQKSNCHFKNRVFDRDSFELMNFKINFFFVMKAYVLKKNSVLKSFREICYKVIRDTSITHYTSMYKFYKFFPTTNLEQFVKENFKAINGKIYRASSTEHGFILGLAQNEEFNEENERVMSLFLDNGTVEEIILI